MPKALTMEEKVAKVEAKQEQVRSTLERGTRGKRASFNGTEGKLRVSHQIPGYHLHIFNDTPGRIEQALEVGYTFVSPDEVGGTSTNVVSRNTDLGDKVRFLVGTDGLNPQYGYLMKLPQEYYEEDQKELQDRNDLSDKAIRSGKLNKDGQSSDGFYDAGIKMSS